VTLLGHTLTVVTDSDASRIEELAAELDRLLTRISSRTGSGDPVRIALLACLQLSEQLRRLMEETQAADKTPPEGGFARTPPEGGFARTPPEGGLADADTKADWQKRLDAVLEELKAATADPANPVA
jgi:cell division protein ZapA (FtsZ GTPase activity inhibitor)